MAGVLFIQTIEPVEVQWNPNEDAILVFEDVLDDAAETPIDHTADLIVLDILDQSGNVVVPCSTAGLYLSLRAGTVNVIDGMVPWSVVGALAPGQYHGDLVQIRDGSREVLCSLVIQREIA